MRRHRLLDGDEVLAVDEAIRRTTDFGSFESMIDGIMDDRGYQRSTPTLRPERHPGHEHALRLARSATQALGFAVYPEDSVYERLNALDSELNERRPAADAVVVQEEPDERSLDAGIETVD